MQALSGFSPAVRRKDDCLFLPVTVEIGKLHRLLIPAGYRRGILHALGHDAVDGLCR